MSAADSDNLPKIETLELSVFYGTFRALKNVTFSIPRRKITAMIGPSGCGKSTLLRCLNRMNDSISGFRQEGSILLDGRDICRQMENAQLRRRVGMVFQRPNPFPLSVFDNVSYGPKIHGERNRAVLNSIVEQSLRATGLWNELKDELDRAATSLSLETQQRLCISRLVASSPEVLLMDEPCSALDPVSTLKIEELMRELSKNYTIVIVTHNMQQAARISDTTGFMLLGELVECGPTGTLFTNPSEPRTEAYVTGRFG